MTKMLSSGGRKGKQPTTTTTSSSECVPSSSSVVADSAAATSEAIGKSSNSSNETVIARIETTTNVATSAQSSSNHQEPPTPESSSSVAAVPMTGETTTTTTSVDTVKAGLVAAAATGLAAAAPPEAQENSQCGGGQKRRKPFKSFLMFTAHLNPFQQQQQQQASGQSSQKGSSVCLIDENNNQIISEVQQQQQETARTAKASGKTSGKPRSYLGLLGLGHHLQRYFGSQRNAADFNGHHSSPASQSAPVTPIKWRPLEGDPIKANGYNQLQQQQRWPSDGKDKTTTCDLSNKSGSSKLQGPGQVGGASSPARPSVRFVDGGGGGGDGDKLDDPPDKDPDAIGSDLVARLFRLPEGGGLEERPGECPMNSDKFRQYGYSLIDYISNYLDTIDKRRVTPLNIEPGYLKSLIKPDAPAKGESFASIMHDFENHIMCGITHWQHPHFHAYFPAGNAYPSILADMLSDALGCVGFSWAASPAYTELEIIMLDWMGKMVGLPDEFLCLSGGRSGGGESKGGGVIQGSASECVLVNLLAARHWAMEKLRKRYPNTQDGILLSKLIGYCSKEAHSCVEKAAMIGFIRMRALDTDERHSLRGDTLAKAMAADQAQGLEPFIVCATLGTTSCVSFDNLEELGEVCQRHDVWLHVDAAYAGSALICPEFKYLMRGIERATSFNMNPNKWMLINFDCSLMWVKDRFKLTRAFVVDPLYLQHSFSDQAIDYRHWGIPLSRRFRALKLWFVIRNYGVEGLQAYIRNHVKLAKLFEQLIRQDARFSITNEVVLGLVCFRLVGSNALNQRLLSMINASGKLHMVPASLNGRYVIRFCVCDRDAQEADIKYAYRCISDFATELFELIRAGKERIRAISQQNTIDVSSLSLHKQQSASADCLNNAAAAAAAAQVDSQEEELEELGAQQVSCSNGPLANGSSATPLSARNSPSAQQVQAQLSLSTNKSPLMKQASVQPQVDPQQQQPQQPPPTDEDLEQEIVLDSLATIDGYDYDLDDDDLLEPPFFGDETPEVGGQQAAATCSDQQQQQQPDETNEWRSPVARHWSSRAGRASRNQTLGGPPSGAGAEHEDEAKDEVFTLAERRQRMSLRYKREFFVRVVSDPRVYRASISGDINAHSSSCSLGGSQHQVTAGTKATATSVPSAAPQSVNATSSAASMSSVSDEACPITTTTTSNSTRAA